MLRIYGTLLLRSFRISDKYVKLRCDYFLKLSPFLQYCQNKSCSCLVWGLMVGLGVTSTKELYY